MKPKIPCEVVRDLLPSYVDGLTSETTNGLVEEHIADCALCKRALELMKAPTKPLSDAAETAEIDFLKKTKRRTRKTVIFVVLTAVFFVAAVLFAKAFFLGNEIYADSVACTVQVEGDRLTLRGTPADSALTLSSAAFSEENGVVTVTLRAVLVSPFSRNDFQAEYHAAQEITQVRVGNRILWANGKDISAATSAVFQTRHSYVGNMSQNDASANALNMVSHLGRFTNTLQTETEPYGWTMTLSEDIPSAQRAAKERLMKSFAYVLLGVIDNLGEVSYEYQTGGMLHTVTVTQAEATAFAGNEIKNCGKDPALLQALMEKTGLNLYSVATVNTTASDNAAWFELVNGTDMELMRIGVFCSENGKLCSTHVGENADGTPIGRGETMSFTLTPQDFGGETQKYGKEWCVKVTLYGYDGEVYEIEQDVSFPYVNGILYRVTLTGNSANGYRLE
ncbi:MAG: DUF4825 domain-containing protein [Faecousia sp.]